MTKYDHKHSALYKAMTDDLAKGVMNADFLEKFKIADQTRYAKHAEDFQTYMEGITKRVLGDAYDPQKHNFRFVISVDNKPNAAIFDEASPPIVMMSSALINAFTTEDQLAAVLAHELTHFGLNTQHNSKAEELASDIWSVFALHRAGYNPKALIEALELTGGEDKPYDAENTVALALSFLNPHPKTPLRLRAIENALFVLTRDEGLRDINVENTPANEAIKQTVSETRHFPYAVHWMVRTGYHKATPAEKLKLLTDAIPGEFGSSLRFYSERIDTFKNMLLRLPSSCMDEENADALTALVDKIFTYEDDELSSSRTDLYNALGKALDPYASFSGGAPKLGKRLKALDEAIQDLHYADTPAQADAAAAQMKEASFDFTFAEGGTILFSMPWNGFRVPTEAALNMTWQKIDDATAGMSTEEERQTQLQLGISPVWDQHVKWAIENKSVTLAQALFCFGIRDPRLMAAFEDHLPENVAEWSNKNSDFDKLLFSPDGKIIGSTRSFYQIVKNSSDTLNDDIYARITTYEKNRMARLEKQMEETLASGVKWGLLEQGDDFLAFLNKYHDKTQPQLTNAEGGTAFAEAVLEKIDGLVARDPEKYRAVVRDFFVTETIAKNYDSRRESGQKKKLRTIPDMLQEDTDHDKWRLPYYFNSSYGHMLGLGISLAHPYTTFVLEDPHGLFSVNDKLEYLKNSRFMRIKEPRSYKNPDYDFLIDMSKVVGFKKPETVQDLVAVVNQIESHQDTTPQGKGSNIVTRYGAYAVAREFLDSYDGHMDSDSFNRIALLLKNDHSNGGVPEQLAASLRGQIVKNSVYELGHASTPELVKAYNVYAVNGLLSRIPDMRKKYDSVLQERLAAINDMGEAQTLTESLLFSCRIDNPKLRKQVIDLWCKSQLATYGIDDKSEEYGQRIADLTARVIKDAKGFVSSEMMSSLATAIEAQEKCAFAIRDALKESIKEALTSNEGHGVGVISEFGLDVLSKNEQTRRDLLDFLTTPLANGSVDNLYNTLEAFMNTKEQGRPGANKRTTANGFYRAIIGYAYMNAGPEQKKGVLELVHENFWSMPLEVRTLYIEKVLFPVGENTGFRESSDRVLNAVFPAGDKYADLGRKIVGAYLDNVPEYSQRLMLSALMIASESAGSKAQTEEDVGRTLALVLVNLGPAGVKLAQAIHSHPDTPEAIRRGMDDVKGRADLPLRWDVFTRLHQALPEEKMATVDHVGAVLGGGSFQYTLKTIKTDGTETALSLLRRNVRPRAETEFENFTTTAEAVIADYPEFAPLRNMIAQAQSMVPVETDFNLGKRQSDIAGELYNGLKITVGSETFTFSTVTWLDHGTEYKEATIAPGMAFNDMQDSDHKRNLAKAIVTAELYMILSGRCFDYDRHGSNLHGDANDVIGFDYGGMSLQPPTKEEKLALGKIIAKAVRSSQSKGTPLASALADSAASLEGSVKDSPYIAAVQRSALSLGDYFKVLTQEDVNDVVKGLLQSNGLDADIKSAVQKNLGMGMLAKMFVKNAGAKKSSIIIEDASASRAKPAALQLKRAC